MLKAGILNPNINSLLSRVRHTNTLVIADRGFPFWPQIETVDISLVDDIPRVLDVLRSIRANFAIGRVFMAEEFRAANQAAYGRVRTGAEGLADGLRTPRGPEEARSAGHRADPHRRYGSVRQHDPGVRVRRWQ